VDLQTGAVAGRYPGIVVAGNGIWELKTEASQWECDCSQSRCNAMQQERKDLLSGKEAMLIQPGENWSSLKQSRMLSGSVGPVLFIRVQQEGVACSQQPRLEQFFTVVDLRDGRPRALYETDEESQVSTGRSWAIRSMILDPNVPLAGSAQVGWARPIWEGGQLQILYRFYALSKAGTGDNLVAPDTVSVEQRIERVPRLLIPWAQAPEVLKLEDAKGWSLVEPGLTLSAFFKP
jgi:hypothetical protein